MKIIALTGHKQNGKTTAVNYLEKYFTSKGFNVRRINFKDSLIDEMKSKLPDTIEQIRLLYSYHKDYRKTRAMYNGDPDKDFTEWSVDELFEKKPPIFRALMQNYGTDIRRSDDPSYWINKYITSCSIADVEGNIDIVLTDDVRFPNEKETIEKSGGLLLRVVRVGVENDKTHESESYIDSFDCECILAENVQELQEKIDIWLTKNNL